ncbi:MAG: hypothetical protein ACK40G_10080 [Cytophagaceae bacterium]
MSEEKDKLLREAMQDKFNDFEVEPADDAWEKISSNIHNFKLLNLLLKYYNFNFAISAATLGITIFAVFNNVLSDNEFSVKATDSINAVESVTDIEKDHTNNKIESELLIEEITPVIKESSPLKQLDKNENKSNKALNESAEKVTSPSITESPSEPPVDMVEPPIDNSVERKINLKDSTLNYRQLFKKNK